MKLLVLSDLHAEHSPFVPDHAVVAAADIVVLAGDIHAGAQVAPWSRKTFADKPVVLIAGNHEFYDGHWTRTIDEIRESALRHEVHFLENDAVTVGGVQFLGATLWTDFMYFGEAQFDRVISEAQRYMMDCKAINGCTPEETIKRHHSSLAWLTGELNRPLEATCRVVVTHHYPHKKSTASEYSLDRCTAAFGSHLPEDLFAHTGLWIHGHTHTSYAYEVKGCQVICNPRGYPLDKLATRYENKAFNPGLLLDLGD